MENACPKCNSTKFKTERRPNGDSICLECGYKGKTFYFVNDVKFEEKNLLDEDEFSKGKK